MIRHALGLGLVLLSGTTAAHHSSIGIYDEVNPVEIEGIVTEVHWRNPHASYTVAVTDGSGNTVDWLVETGSINRSPAVRLKRRDNLYLLQDLFYLQ